MHKRTESIEESTYVVVFRCTESLIRVPAGRGILIEPIASAFGHYTLKILTRTEDQAPFEVPIPRELWLEVTGPAPSLDVAVEIAAVVSDEFVRQLAFGANAWQGLLTVHLAYESTPKKHERAFFQNWIKDEMGLPRVARTVDPDLMYRLLSKIAQCTERERPRILRAIIQYSDALQYWRPGGEIYALAHLYMGIHPP